MPGKQLLRKHDSLVTLRTLDTFSDDGKLWSLALMITEVRQCYIVSTTGRCDATHGLFWWVCRAESSVNNVKNHNGF